MANQSTGKRNQSDIYRYTIGNRRQAILYIQVFDPSPLLNLVIQNISSFEIISGASTITMQLVRVLEPRLRTFLSKIIETWRAMQLEYFFSKMKF